MLTAYRKGSCSTACRRNVAPCSETPSCSELPPLPYLCTYALQCVSPHGPGGGGGGGAALLVASSPLVSGGRDSFGVAS